MNRTVRAALAVTSGVVVFVLCLLSHSSARSTQPRTRLVTARASTSGTGYRRRARPRPRDCCRDGVVQLESTRTAVGICRRMRMALWLTAGTPQGDPGSGRCSPRLTIHSLAKERRYETMDAVWIFIATLVIACVAIVLQRRRHHD